MTEILCTLLYLRSDGKANDPKLIHKYLCPHCCYTTWHASNYKRHTLVHTGERPFTCTLCNKGFTQKQSLNTHLLVHAGIKPFLCQICNQPFRSKNELRYHRIRHNHL